MLALVWSTTPAVGGEPPTSAPAPDWLVTPIRRPAKVEVRDEGKELVLANGLVRRVFRVRPNFATVDLTNLSTGATLLRGVKPEAAIVIDGKRFEVGGLKGQPDYAYLDPSWLDAMTADPEAFQYESHRIGTPQASYPWSPRRHSQESPWPPRGVTLTIRFRPPARLAATHPGLALDVVYTLYDGVPLMEKSIRVENSGPEPASIDQVECEILAVNEREKARLHVESNYAFYIAATGPPALNVVDWGPDPDYKSQVDYEYRMPLLLTTRYPLGPGVRVDREHPFESFRTIELLNDSDDRERSGMARRRLYRTLSPQVTENPIFMHVRSAEPAAVRLAIDQCAEVGFEMVILTFGSGFNIESEDPEYLANFKKLVDYAHSKRIEIGGYTLMCASRSVGPDDDVISPKTGKPGSNFGQSACLASNWADGYFRRVLNFIDKTGLSVIETDGPFHGDRCASTRHPHHRGLADSQWRQWQACCNFYRECLKRGVYINTPDWYYLNGAQKCAMGYRETNFSLPRARQILIARQNIYDGTFEKTPSMGWMFVPLVQYHGGGAAATLEPLSEHIADYEWHLAQNFGSGVQAAYRGPRLYDADSTKAVVKKWVDFYKSHREVLNADLVHVRRPDGRGLDCTLHVNPAGKEKGLAMVFNPTGEKVSTTLTLPLAYAVPGSAPVKVAIRRQDGAPREAELNCRREAAVDVTLEPRSFTWFVVE
jgi:hypothetical protein